MLEINPESQPDSLLAAAELICVAARTAPKGKGRDLLTTAVLTGEDKQRIVEQMHVIAEREGVATFSRDAANIEAAPVVVLLGTRLAPLGLRFCGLCGFGSCAGMEAATGQCAFNAGDLGIAVGSAVSRAADLRLDNRVMYTVGMAVRELGLLGEEVGIVYGIPLSATGKNPFFDRG